MGIAYITITCRIDGITSRRNDLRVFREAFVTTETFGERPDLQHEIAV